MRHYAACLAFALLVNTQPSQAVLIDDGDGSGNTTTPADDFGFANVGIRGSGSAVYLGHGWVLTAAHVGAGATCFQNVWYDEVPGSAVQLANPPNPLLAPVSDLTLFQIEDPPNLPPVSILSSAPAVGWDVTMIGNGRDRDASEASWTSSWAPATSPSPYAGYIWASANDIRFGTNTIDLVSIPQSEVEFRTTFGPPGTGNDAQGAPGDSGGGVFYKDASGAWSLVGLISSVSVYPGQPWGTSVFGEATFSADLSVYRSQIYQTMALPGDANFDGVVNSQDMAVIASHWLHTGAAVPGDANHDGVVNAQDLEMIASNWTEASSAAASVTAPEASTIILAALGGVASLAFRRRTRRHDRSLHTSHDLPPFRPAGRRGGHKGAGSAGASAFFKMKANSFGADSRLLATSSIWLP